MRSRWGRLMSLRSRRFQQLLVEHSGPYVYWLHRKDIPVSRDKRWIFTILLVAEKLWSPEMNDKLWCAPSSLLPRVYLNKQCHHPFSLPLFQNFQEASSQIFGEREHFLGWSRKNLHHGRSCSYIACWQSIVLRSSCSRHCDFHETTSWSRHCEFYETTFTNSKVKRNWLVRFNTTFIFAFHQLHLNIGFKTNISSIFPCFPTTTYYTRYVAITSKKRGSARRTRRCADELH